MVLHLGCFNTKQNRYCVSKKTDIMWEFYRTQIILVERIVPMFVDNRCEKSYDLYNLKTDLLAYTTHKTKTKRNKCSAKGFWLVRCRSTSGVNATIIMEYICMYETRYAYIITCNNPHVISIYKRCICKYASIYERGIIHSEIWFFYRCCPFPAYANDNFSSISQLKLNLKRTWSSSISEMRATPKVNEIAGSS